MSKVSQNVFENERGSVRPAPGYPVCPDHNIKKILLHLLEPNSGLSLTKTKLLFPPSSITTMVISNPYGRYFSVGNVGEEQVERYAKVSRIKLMTTEKMLNAIIGYIPKYIL